MFSVVQSEGSLPMFFRLDENLQFKHAYAGLNDLKDRLGNSMIRYEPGPMNAAKFNNSSTQNVIRASKDFPFMTGFKLIDESSFLFNRYCRHPPVDHVQTCLFRNGSVINIDSGLGPTQVSYIKAINLPIVYGKYSGGRSEGWKYHTFRYDLLTGRSELLDCPQIGGVSGNDDIVCMPEETTFKFGDFDTHWNHKVELYPRLGHHSTLKIRHQDQFDDCQVGKLFFVVALSNHSLRRGYVALNYSGNEISEITKLIFGARQIRFINDGNDMLVDTNRKGISILVEPD